MRLCKVYDQPGLPWWQVLSAPLMSLLFCVLFLTTGSAGLLSGGSVPWSMCSALERFISCGYMIFGKVYHRQHASILLPSRYSSLALIAVSWLQSSSWSHVERRSMEGKFSSQMVALPLSAQVVSWVLEYNMFVLLTLTIYCSLCLSLAALSLASLALTGRGGVAGRGARRESNGLISR